MREDRLLLLGIFNRLRTAGLPLSVKSYLDVLHAFEVFPEPFVALRGVRAAADAATSSLRAPLGSDRVRDREELVWLCQTLWARSTDEERLVREVVTRAVKTPDTSLTLRLYERLSGLHVEEAAFVPKPPLPPAREVPKPSGTTSATTPAQGPAGTTGGTLASSGTGASEIGADLDDDAELSLPSVRTVPIPGTNRFSMQPEPLMSSLWLTALWRRLFMPRKTVDRRRIDARETVREAARRGVITEPRYAVTHINTARLLVLMDVGACMAPWFEFEDLVRRTLLDSSSRLERVRTGYFVGAPGEQVYLKPSLRGRTALRALIRDASGWPVFVFGEAGAVATSRRDQATRLRGFFAAARDTNLKPIVWVNPMPQARWSDEFRALVANQPHTHALPLNAEALLRAVDLLRGVVTR